MKPLHTERYRGAYQALFDLVENAWSYKMYTDHEPTRKHAVALDTKACLVYSNGSIAVYDGTRLIGVLLYAKPSLKAKLLRPFKKLIMVRHIVYLLLRSQTSRKLLRSLLRLEKTYDDMLKAAKLETENQVVLFITHSDYQGKGIGKKLMQAYETYCRENKIKHFFLFTDTSCNYGYYDHNGFQRTVERDVTLLTKEKDMHMQVYLYEKRI